MKKNSPLKNSLSLIFMLYLLVLSPLSQAERREITIEIINHLFLPQQLKIKSGEKVKLIIFNRDKTPEEFESYELNREKLIMGGRKATIFIGPLNEGEYPFFGEFNKKTALGKIIVE